MGNKVPKTAYVAITKGTDGHKAAFNAAWQQAFVRGSAIDYEADNLIAQQLGHMIACCSLAICTSISVGYVADIIINHPPLEPFNVVYEACTPGLLAFATRASYDVACNTGKLEKKAKGLAAEYGVLCGQFHEVERAIKDGSSEPGNRNPVYELTLNTMMTHRHLTDQKYVNTRVFSNDKRYALFEAEFKEAVSKSQ